MADQVERIQVETVDESGEVFSELRDAIRGPALLRRATRGLAASAQIWRDCAPTRGEPIQHRLPPAPGGEVAVDQDEDLGSRSGFFVMDSQPGSVEERHRFVRCTISRGGAQSNKPWPSPDRPAFR